jgi:hypothetical protein
MDKKLPELDFDKKNDLPPLSFDDLPELEFEDKSTLGSVVDTATNVGNTVISTAQEFGKGIGRGIDQTQALGGGLVAWGGDVLGLKDLADWGVDTYTSNMDEAGENQAKVREFTDIDSASDFSNWLGGTLGELLPTVATMVGTGGVGGLVGKEIAKSKVKKLVKEKAEQHTGKKISNEAVDKLTEATIKQAKRKGFGAGAIGSSVGMETGEIYGDVAQEGYRDTKSQLLALGGGTLAGSLDALPALSVAKRFGLGDKLKGNIAQRLAKSGGITGLQEAGTEAIQTAIEEGTKALIKDENLPDDLAKQMFNASMAGFFGGGALGSIGGIPQSPTDTINRVLPNSLANSEATTFVQNKLNELGTKAKTKTIKPIFKQWLTDNQDKFSEDDLQKIISEAKINFEILEQEDKITPKQLNKELDKQEQGLDNITPKTEEFIQVELPTNIEQAPTFTNEEQKNTYFNELNIGLADSFGLEYNKLATPQNLAQHNLAQLKNIDSENPLYSEAQRVSALLENSLNQQEQKPTITKLDFDNPISPKKTFEKQAKKLGLSEFEFLTTNINDLSNLDKAQYDEKILKDLEQNIADKQERLNDLIDEKTTNNLEEKPIEISKSAEQLHQDGIKEFANMNEEQRLQMKREYNATDEEYQGWLNDVENLNKQPKTANIDNNQGLNANDIAIEQESNFNELVNNDNVFKEYKASQLLSLNKEDLLKIAKDKQIDTSNKNKNTLIDNILDTQNNKEIEPVEPKITNHRPVISYLSVNGLDPKSAFASDLYSQDITPRTARGLFKKPKDAVQHNSGADNIPVGEFMNATGIIPKEDGNGYVDTNWLFEKIVDEYSGNPQYGENEAFAIGEYEHQYQEYERQLLDYKNRNKSADDVNSEINTHLGIGDDYNLVEEYFNENNYEKNNERRSDEEVQESSNRERTGKTGEKTTTTQASMDSNRVDENRERQESFGVEQKEKTKRLDDVRFSKKQTNSTIKPLAKLDPTAKLSKKQAQAEYLNKVDKEISKQEKAGQDTTNTKAQKQSIENALEKLPSKFSGQDFLNEVEAELITFTNPTIEEAEFGNNVYNNEVETNDYVYPIKLGDETLKADSGHHAGNPYVRIEEVDNETVISANIQAGKGIRTKNYSGGISTEEIEFSNIKLLLHYNNANKNNITIKKDEAIYGYYNIDDKKLVGYDPSIRGLSINDIVVERLKKEANKDLINQKNKDNQKETFNNNLYTNLIQKTAQDLAKDGKKWFGIAKADTMAKAQWGMENYSNYDEFVNDHQEYWYYHSNAVEGSSIRGDTSNTVIVNKDINSVEIVEAWDNEAEFQEWNGEDTQAEVIDTPSGLFYYNAENIDKFASVDDFFSGKEFKENSKPNIISQKVYDLYKDRMPRFSKEAGKRLGIKNFVHKAGQNNAPNDDRFIWLKLDEIDTAKPQVMFSKKDIEITDENGLYVVHNLTSSNIKNANKIGGLPAPSIAITNKEFGEFGEISLIGDKKLIDPQADKNNKVYDADIFSPRYPEIHNELDNNHDFWEDMVVLTKKYGISKSYKDDGDFDEFRNFSNKPVVIAKFLDSKNIVIAPKKKKNTDKEFIKYIGKKLPEKYTQQFKQDYIKNSGLSLEDLVEIKGLKKLNTLIQVRYEHIKNIKSAYSIDSYKNDAVLRKEILKPKYKKEYEVFAENLFNSIVNKNGIYTGRTYSGKIKTIPNTIDNLVKIMSKNIIGGENFFYGAGSIRAHIAKKFKTVKQIQDDRNKIVKHDIFQNLKDEINKELLEVLSVIEKNSNISYSEAQFELTEYAKTKHWFNISLPVEAQTKVNDFLQKLKNTPTEYFEAKITRSVGMGEFQYAIVPKNTEKHIKDILKKNGLKIRIYNPRIDGDRARILSSLKRLRFSESQNQNNEQNQKAEQIQEWIKDLPFAKNIKVVDTPKDLGVPNNVRGVWKDGDIYLVASNIENKEEAIQVALHEAIGHDGLRKILGRNLNKVLDSVYSDMAQDVKAVATRLNFDIKDIRQRREATEELIAETAETLSQNINKAPPKFMAKVMSAIRKALRNMNIWDKDVWDKKAILELLARAKQKVESDNNQTPNKDTGEFSKDNDDIRYSTKENQFTFNPADNKNTTNIIRHIQDKFIYIKKLQENIKESGGLVNDNTDFYQKEEAFHGKVENDLKIITDEVVEPLQQFMADNNISSNLLGTYLIAKHTPERNQHIAKINPNMPDGGAGMKTADAIKLVDKVEKSALGKKVIFASQQIYKLLEIKRSFMKDFGLVNERTTDLWQKQYKYYVPLKGFAMDEATKKMPRVGKGFSISGKESIQALGRKSLPENPIYNTINDLTESIVRGRKNEVGQTFLNLVINNPNKDVWQVFTDDNPDTRNVFDKQKEKVVNQKMRMSQELGNPNSDYFPVKKNGTQFYIKIKDENILRALKNLGVEEQGHLIRAMGTATRFLSSMHTSFNPEFIIANWSRDIQTALYNGLAEQDISNSKTNNEKVTKEILKNVMKTYRPIYRALTGKSDKSPEITKYWKEMVANGGKTGFFDTPDIEKQKSNFEKVLKMHQSKTLGKGKKGLLAIRDFVENTNSMIENGVRLSAYMSARKSGVSIEKSVSFAKNLTVNFNRRGEETSVINALFMFFNAGVQGIAQFGRTIVTPKKVDKHLPIIKNNRLNTAQKLGVGMTVFGYLLGEMAKAMSDEDDDGELYYNKIPSYVKERNIVLMRDNGKDYWKIPLPYGYNIFHNIGILTSDVIDKSKPLESIAMDLVSAVSGSFVPIGLSNSEYVDNFLYKSISPTLVKPLTELGLNENYFGSRIYKENFNENTPKPDSALGFNSTGQAWKSITNFLNEATGGNTYLSGGIDIHPETLRYLFGYTTGGAGTFVNKSYETAESIAKGEFDTLEDNKIVFYNKISGKYTDHQDLSNFYNRGSELWQYQNMFKNSNSKERALIKKTYGDKLYLHRKHKATSKQIKFINKRITRLEYLKSNGYEHIIKGLKKQKNKLVDEFNKLYLEN